MKRICAIALALVLMLAVFAGCGGSKEAAPAEVAAPAAPAAAPAAEVSAGNVTWADYRAWLIETFANTSPNPDNFKTLVESIGSWEEIDTSVEPWNKILGDEFFDASTWEEFQTAGVGTYNSSFVDDYESSGEPTGEASGEPSAEPAA